MIKDDFLKVRLSKEEKEKIRYFARRKGLTMSDYIKYCIMKIEAQESLKGDHSNNDAAIK